MHVARLNTPLSLGDKKTGGLMWLHARDPDDDTWPPRATTGDEGSGPYA